MTYSRALRAAYQGLVRDSCRIAAALPFTLLLACSDGASEGGGGVGGTRGTSTPSESEGGAGGSGRKTCNPQPGLCACFDEGPCLELQHQQWGERGTAYATFALFDDSGNLYITASSVAGLGVAGLDLAKRSNVIRWTPEGEPESVMQWPGELDVNLRGLGLDPDGALVMAGMAAPNGEGYSDLDLFLRKLTPAGEQAWVVDWRSDASDSVAGLGIDGDGNVYVAGFAQGAVAEATALGLSDGFVTKWSSAGEYQWTHQFGTDQDDFCQDVVVDAVGNSYVVGQTAGAFVEDPGEESDGYVIKIDAQGQELWRRQFGGDANAIARGVALTPDGIVVTGAHGIEDLDAVLLAYSADGDLLWERTWGHEDDTQAGVSIAVSETGRVFVGMESTGELPQALSDNPTPGNSALVISEWTLGGELLWAYEYGSESHDHPWRLALDQSDRIAFVGGAQAGLPGFTYETGVHPFVTWVTLLE